MLQWDHARGKYGELCEEGPYLKLVYWYTAPGFCEGDEVILGGGKKILFPDEPLARGFVSDATHAGDSNINRCGSSEW